MRFAVFDIMQPQGKQEHATIYRHMLEQCRLAEEGGLEAYYLTEHHFDPAFSIDPTPNILLGALATHTSRIRLGAMTTVLPYHHPVRVAQEIRALDMVTGGRLDVAFGRGAVRHEQLGWGVLRSETSEMFETAFQIIRKLLTDDSLPGYESKWWKGGPVRVTPEATQRPHPPLWFTAVSQTSTYKAGRLGVHCATAFRSEAERIENVANYHAGWEEWESENPGSPPGEFGALHRVFVAETNAEARRMAQPNIEGWAAHLLKVLSDRPVDDEEPTYVTHRRMHEAVSGSTFDDLIEDNRVILGTPDECVQQLRRMESSGVDLFQACFQFGDLDHEASNRSMKLFCEEVLPHFRTAKSTERAMTTP